jgi:hypothetical protein
MMPNMGMQPSIILLKEGTDSSQGKAQLISNINACAAVADIVRTTLGPRGMDKLIHHNGSVSALRQPCNASPRTLSAFLLSRGCLKVCAGRHARTLLDLSLACISGMP